MIFLEPEIYEYFYSEEKGIISFLLKWNKLFFKYF